MKRSSMKTKLLLSTICCVMLAAMTVSVISIFGSKSKILEKSQQRMRNATIITADAINNDMTQIETATGLLASTLLNSITDDTFKNDASVDKLTDSLRVLAEDCAKSAPGAITYYIRYNPDIAYPTSGLFGQTDDGGNSYKQLECTDFTAFDKNDTAVSWYYGPVNYGSPIWMSPYYNSNIDVYMISYVIPVFRNGQSIGIVGMDISMAGLEKLAGELNADSQHAFFLTKENTTLYHDTLNDGDAFSTELTLDTFAYLDGHAYVSEGLKNGFKLVLGTPKSSLSREGTLLSVSIAIGSIIAMIIGGAVCLCIIKKCIDPLTSVAETVEELGKFNLSSDAKLEKYTGRNDEIGQISNAVNQLKNELTETIGDLTDISISLSSMSETLSSNSTSALESMQNIDSACGEIASGATSQASDTENTTRLVADITSAIENANKHLTALTDISNKVQESTELANNKLSEVMNSNAKTTDITEVIRKSIGDTNTSTDKIKVAAQSISEIAEQTNLLSLNASIEAARAGEAGRGFAVVAGEIQNLSDASNRAANEIQQIIDELVANSNRSVNDINTAITITENQTKILNEVIHEFSEAKNGLVETIKKLSDVVDLNNNVAIKQGSVLDNVQGLSAIAQENAASTEEVSATISFAKEVIAEMDKKASALSDAAVKLQNNTKKWTL